MLGSMIQRHISETDVVISNICATLKELLPDNLAGQSSSRIHRLMKTEVGAILPRVRRQTRMC